LIFIIFYFLLFIVVCFKWQKKKIINEYFCIRLLLMFGVIEFCFFLAQIYFQVGKGKGLFTFSSFAAGQIPPFFHCVSAAVYLRRLRKVSEEPCIIMWYVRWVTEVERKEHGQIMQVWIRYCTVVSSIPLMLCSTAVVWIVHSVDIYLVNSFHLTL